MENNLICCLCLKQYLYLEPIHDDPEDNKNVKNCDKLRICIPEEIWYKTYKICKTCIDLLEASYQFIYMCLKSEQKRRDIYKTNDSPYRCNDCKKTFKIETRLKKHLEACHPLTDIINIINDENTTEENQEVDPTKTEIDAISDINNEENQFKSDEKCIDVKGTTDNEQSEIEDGFIVKNNKEEIKDEEENNINHHNTSNDGLCIINNEEVGDDLDNEDGDPTFDDTGLANKSESSDVSSSADSDEDDDRELKPRTRRKKRMKKDVTKKGTVRKKGSHPCQYCSEIFRTEAYLRKHTITKHTLERPYKCDQCDATYRGKDMLVIHKRKHTGETPFVCSVCGKAFKSSHGLFVHNQTHSTENRYACQHCEKAFKTLGNLRKHLICVHTKSEDYKYQCNQCGHKFPFKGHLDKHLIRHTGIKNFPCRICGKMFILKTDAELHIRRTHNNDQLFSCEVCQKEFRSYEGLQKHLKTAHNLGNYKVHVQVKKLLCPYCPKMFPYNNKLQRHILTHTGEKPYRCNVLLCTKGFRDKTDLKAHLKNSHQITDCTSI